MSFSGLNVSMRGLFASQSALDMTSQNITNTSTPGYVRRVANFSSVSKAGIKGVTVEPERMRDSYLDNKVWTQNSITNEWTTKSQYYEEIMDVFDEPSDYSINVVINEFFGAFQSLADDPSDMSYRRQVLQKAYQFTDILNNMSSQLDTLQYDLNEKVKIQSEAINGVTQEIAKLTLDIYNTEIVGGDASYSRDALEEKIKELSQYGNVEVKEEKRGKLVNGAEDIRTTVMFGGIVIVDNFKARELVCEKRLEKNNPEDIDGLYRVTTKEGTSLDLSSGSLKALIDLRDGDGNGETWVKGVTYYQKELNKFAKTFVKAFNEGITDYNKDGQITDGEKKLGYADAYVYGSPKDATEPAGIRFFTIDGVSSADFINGETDINNINALYDNVTAKNIKLSSDVLDNIDSVISSFKSPTYETDTQSILDLVAFREDTKIFGTGDVDSFVESIVTSVGLDADMAMTLNESNTALLEQAESNRSAYSDVSIDEETTYLIMYQKMYKACANAISTYSQLFDTLLASV